MVQRLSFFVVPKEVLGEGHVQAMSLVRLGRFVGFLTARFDTSVCDVSCGWNSIRGVCHAERSIFSFREEIKVMIDTTHYSDSKLMIILFLF